MEDLLGSGQNFERWIKMGSVTKGSAVEDDITLVTGKLEQLPRGIGRDVMHCSLCDKRQAD